MPSLIDVNVALSLIVRAHPARPSAAAWWDSVEDASVVFCLPVRMGVLRLLSNPRVMGASVLRPEHAWEALATLTSDCRAMPEEIVPGDSVDPLWRSVVESRAPTPNRWAEAWLVAYAEYLDYEFVTFDRGFRSLGCSNLRLLQV